MIKNILTSILFVTVAIFVISIYVLLFQTIGVDNANKATILSGILSMIGGATGAFGAYFIAKMQMTKQLELQYRKEEEKLIKEVKINNYLKVLEIGNNLHQSLSNLKTFLADASISIKMRESDSIIKNDQLISNRLQEAKEIPMRMSTFLVFYEKDERSNFIDLENQIREMAVKIYETYSDVLNSTIDSEEELNISNEYAELYEMYKFLIDKPQGNLLEIIKITHRHLIEHTNRK